MTKFFDVVDSEDEIRELIGFPNEVVNNNDN